jgi:hypothetical protein
VHSDDTFVTVAAVLFFLGLVTAWATVAVRTAEGTLRSTPPSTAWSP